MEHLVHDEDALFAFGYVNAEAQEGLLGKITQIRDPKKKAAATKKLFQKSIAPGGALTPRDEALKRLGGLPEHIREGLAKKDLQLSDAIIYTTKPFGGVAGQQRVFTDADVKAPGVGNLNKGQLEKDQWFLVTHIRFTSGVDPDPLNAAYGVIPKEIANGDFEFKANSKYLMPKDTSSNIFDTTNESKDLQGMVKLSNPKWMEPQTSIEFNFRPSKATVANTNVKIELIGVQVLPA